MSFSIQFLRGSTAENNAYVGKEGEITIDTATQDIRIHDGATPGGAKILGETQLNALINSKTSKSAIDALDIDAGTVDGKSASAFAPASHSHNYLSTTGKAADSNLLDGHDSSYFATSTHNHDTRYYTKSQVDSAIASSSGSTDNRGYTLFWS